MSNKNISGLSAASTPLTGTELVPVWNGSNTVKVSITNLTDGRNVPMVGAYATGLSTLGSTLNVNWDSATKGAQLGSYGAVYEQEVDATTALSCNVAISNAGTGATKYIISQPASRVRLGLGRINFDIAFTGTAGSLIGSNWGTPFYIDTNFNFVVGTSGKGIDFSAHSSAAGMTSKVLVDYEEGTWTPEFTSSGGDFTTSSYGTQIGTYVRVGRLVHIYGQIQCNSLTGGSGVLQIKGLPFTAVNSNETVPVTFSFGWVNNPCVVAATNAASTKLALFKTLVNDDCPYDAGPNYFRFSGSYQV